MDGFPVSVYVLVSTSLHLTFLDPGVFAYVDLHPGVTVNANIAGNEI